MLHAYNKMYLYDAMHNLAEAFDVAVNDYDFTLDYFVKLFIVSGISYQFEKGNPKYISGKSGVELVVDVISRVEDRVMDVKCDYSYRIPKEDYWVGWVLAYYQWYSAKTFKEIQSIITMQRLKELYHPYHEMDEERIIEYIDKEAEKTKCVKRLQAYRKKLGMSQSELAKASGINLRTLQQYEIGAKDISKASVSTVLALSRVLERDVRDLCG